MKGYDEKREARWLLQVGVRPGAVPEELLIRWIAVTGQGRDWKKMLRTNLFVVPSVSVQTC